MIGATASAAVFLLSVGAAFATALPPDTDAPAATDYLHAATAFADCMIRYGRDRYGSVHSPLFSNSLTREAEPRILPCPLFADPRRESEDMATPFRRFDYNKVLNYPAGLGAEGPHKVTVYGCDPYEDRELYEFLFDLTRITGNTRYGEEARKALRWWFTHTQGTTGLYPWGEHLGWDFEYDCPTYFDGPSQYLYAACYHEVKDDVPFLDVLAELPATRPGAHTPLEAYAFGIWRAHFWDKENAYYCRHGDYTGQDDRAGSTAGFPAHLAAYLQVWITAYLASDSDEPRTELARIINRALDMAIVRTEAYGFFPFTFEPELTGKQPGKQVPAQSLRLARHARDLARRLTVARPSIAAKLERLARLHLGDEVDAPAPPAARPSTAYTELQSTRCTDHAAAIMKDIERYRTYGDPAFLEVAGRHAAKARGLFLSDMCPLPRYRAAALTTMSGDAFPDFYFRGAALMHAFALLGEALDEAPTRSAGGNKAKRRD